MNLFIKPHAGRYFSMEAMQKIKCLTIEDSNFPDRLRKLSGMPKKLYYIGNLPDPKKPAAAVQSREDEIEFCKAHGITLPFDANHSYSRDRNLWHISHEEIGRASCRERV